MDTTYSICPSCQGINKIGIDQALSSEPLCGKCGTTLPTKALVTEVDGAGLRTLRDKLRVPLIVCFWAEWCEACKDFLPIFQVAS